MTGSHFSRSDFLNDPKRGSNWSNALFFSSKAPTVRCVFQIFNWLSVDDGSNTIWVLKSPFNWVVKLWYYFFATSSEVSFLKRHHLNHLKSVFVHENGNMVFITLCFFPVGCCSFCSPVGRGLSSLLEEGVGASSSNDELLVSRRFWGDLIFLFLLWLLGGCWLLASTWRDFYAI